MGPAPSCNRGAPVHERGSLFVESMLSAAMVAFILAAMLRVTADGAIRERGLDDRRTALLIAQSELDAVGSAIPLEPGRSAGYAGDMVWHVDLYPYSQGGGPEAAGVLWRVAVGVAPRTGGPDIVSLQSLRLGRAT